MPGLPQTWNPYSKGSPSFSGSVAAVSVRPGFPTSPHDTHFTSCEAIVSAGISASTLDPSWTAAATVLRSTYRREELCSDFVHDFWMKYFYGYQEFREVCETFGGRLLLQEELTSREMNASVRETCVTDETHLSWVGQEHLDPAASLQARCVTLLVNGSLGSRACLNELECSVCRVSEGLRYTLYGRIQDFDRYYFLKALPDGNIIFEGLETSVISQEGGSWVVRSRLHHRFWQLTRSPWPIGRRPWSSTSQNITLLFTSCTAFQFSSHDGHCLPWKQRCNYQVESPDDSDELGCPERTVEKITGYQRLATPSPGGLHPPVLYFQFFVKNVRDISTENGVANMDVQMMLFWTEPRVRFWDVTTPFKVFPCDEVWLPDVGVRAGYRDTGEDIELDVYTRLCGLFLQHGQPQHLDMSDPFMGEYGRKTGHESFISQIQPSSVNAIANIFTSLLAMYFIDDKTDDGTTTNMLT